MDIIGIRIRVSNISWEKGIKLDKVGIARETDKQYRVQNSGTIFDSLQNIPKNIIGKIQGENRYLNSIERKVWVLEDAKYNQKAIIETLKQSVQEEIDNRKTILENFQSDLNSL